MHDIDESAAKNLSDELMEKRCAPLISNHLKSINGFTLQNFKRYEISGVTVFEEKKLASTYSIQKQLCKWFKNVPENDILEIDRIYVITRDKQDYAGNYMPVLFFINLVWHTPFSRWNPLFWFFILFDEHSLYHEIGHHACRHTFGRDLDQERDANRYAAKRMLEHYPVLGGIVSFIARLIRLKDKKSARY